jgi:lipoate-protein ligase A
MALDHALLEHASIIGRPLLRLYGWIEPAATFGYFQKYSEVASWTKLRPLIRRPTGGGLVPHDNDWTYTLVFPPGHWWYELRAEQSYEKAHRWVAAAFEDLRVEATLAKCRLDDLPGQCFAGAEKFDVLFGGKKIAGAAQRRNQAGLLIQGSVQANEGLVSRFGASPKDAKQRGREAWEAALLAEGTKQFGVAWAEFEISAAIKERAEELKAERYSRDEYNRKRG